MTTEPQNTLTAYPHDKVWWAVRFQPYARVTSQLQQSLHRKHFRHRWFSHVSFVQATQMSFDGSPQMLHENTNVFTGGAAGFCSGRGASAVFVSSTFHDIVVPRHLRS